MSTRSRTATALLSVRLAAPLPAGCAEDARETSDGLTGPTRVVVDIAHAAG